MNDYSSLFEVSWYPWLPNPAPKYLNEIRPFHWYVVEDRVHQVRNRIPIHHDEFDLEPRNLLGSKDLNALSHPKSRIIFRNDMEHRYMRLTKDIYKHLHYTIDCCGLNPRAVFYISGNFNEEQKYTQWCNQNSISSENRINALGAFGWNDFSTLTYTEFSGSWLTQEKRKSFLCFNRRMHCAEHRHLTLYYLQQLGHMNQGYVSNPLTDEQDYIGEYSLDPEIYRQAGRKRILDTPATNDLGAGGTAALTPWKLYANSQFSIVTESDWRTDGKTMRFYTEKTARAILYGHPFVIVGECGANTDLARLGVEPYNELFDLNTDLIPDLNTRIQAQLSSIRYHWDDREIAHYLKEKILHNRNSIQSDRFNATQTRKIIRLAHEI